MSYLEQAQEPGTPKRAPGRKILAGCAIGCVSLVLLSVAGCFGLTMYLTRPGKPADPYAMISAESSAFLRADLDLADPGLDALFRRFINLEKTHGIAGLPGGLREFLRTLAEQPEENLKLLTQVIGVQLIVVAQAAEDGDDIFVVGSIKKMPRLWGIILGLFEKEIAKKNGFETYEGEKLLKGDDGENWIAFVDHHLVIGKKPAVVKSAIDRVRLAEKGPIEFAGTPTLKEAVQALDANRDLAFGITNEKGTLSRAVRKMKGEKDQVGLDELMAQVLDLPTEEIVYVAVDVDVQSEQKTDATVQLKLRDPQGSPDLRDRLNYLLTTVENNETILNTGLVITHELRDEGDRLKIRLEINGVWDAIERAVKVAAKKEGAPAPAEAPETQPDEQRKVL